MTEKIYSKYDRKKYICFTLEGKLKDRVLSRSKQEGYPNEVIQWLRTYLIKKLNEDEKKK